MSEQESLKILFRRSSNELTEFLIPLLYRAAFYTILWKDVIRGNLVPGAFLTGDPSESEADEVSLDSIHPDQLVQPELWEAARHVLYLFLCGIDITSPQQHTLEHVRYRMFGRPVRGAEALTNSCLQPKIILCQQRWRSCGNRCHL